MKSELNLGVLFTGKIDSSFDAVLKKIQTSLGQLQGATAKVTAAQKQQQSQTLSMQNGLKSYIKDVEKLLQIQARWYGAKMILFTAVSLPFETMKKGLDFFVQVDQAEAKIRRYSVMLEELNESSKGAAHELILLARQLNLKYATPFEDIVKGADRLIAAGVEATLVMGGLLEEFVKFQTAWPEVEMDKFTKAVVGMENTFKNMPGMKELSSDLERYKAILDKVTVAMGVGVMEPRDLPKVMQHFGQMAQSIGLSVDEMMALSVLVTNLGSNASTAARALRGLSSSLVQEDKMKLFKELGIEINRNIPLGRQLISVLDQIRAKVTGSGEQGISVGAQTILGKLTSVERVGPLIALIRDMESYKEILDQVQKSTGANDRASKEMNSTFGAQWKVFVELIKEIGAALYNSELLGEVMFALKLVVLGLGKAFFVISEVLKQFNFGLISSITLVYAIGKAISELSMKPLQDWSDWIEKKKFGEIERFLQTRALLFGETPEGRPTQPTVLTPAAARLAGRKSKAGKEDLFVPNELSKDKNSYPALIASQKAIANARLEIQKQYDSLQLKLLENVHKLGLISDEKYYTRKLSLLESSLKKEKAILANEWAVTEKVHDEAISKAEGNANLIKANAAKDADYARMLLKKKSLDYQLEAAKDDTITQRKIDNIERVKLDSEAAYKVSEILRKKDVDKEKFTIDQRQTLNEWRFQNGLKNEKDFYADSKVLIEENKNTEIKALEDAHAAFTKKAYAEIDAKGTMDKRILEIRRDIREKDAQLPADIASAERKANQETNQITLTDSSNTLEQKRRMIENDYKILEIIRQFDTTQEKMSIEDKQSLNEWMYSQLLIKASDYYSEAKKLSDKNHEATKINITKEYENFKTANDSLQKEEAEGSTRKKALQDDLRQRTTQYYADLKIAGFDYSRVQEQLRQKEYEDFEKLYADEGIVGVVQRSVGNITREFEQYGNRWKTFAETIATGMSDAFETFFTDSMKLQLQSLGDYFNLFIGSIQKAMARFLAEETTMYFLKAFKSGISMMMGQQMGQDVPMSAIQKHSGGVVGSNDTRVNVPSWLFANAPRLHGGLKADEFPAILQSGETVIPKGRSASPNIEVNIQNETGTPVGKGDVKIDFNLDKMVVGIILKNIAQNGPLRGLMNGRAA